MLWAFTQYSKNGLFLSCGRHWLDRFPSYGPSTRNTLRISRDSKTTQLCTAQEYVGCNQVIMAVVQRSRQVVSLDVASHKGGD